MKKRTITYWTGGNVKFLYPKKKKKESNLFVQKSCRCRVGPFLENFEEEEKIINGSKRKKHNFLGQPR